MMNYMSHASKIMGRRLPSVIALFTMRAKLTMRVLLTLSALLSLSTFSYASAASNVVTPSVKTTIELPLQGVTLEYKANVRLLQVLDDANAIFNVNVGSNVTNSSSIGYFPLSAQLFDKTNTKANGLNQDIEAQKR
ncbi:MAG: hypothetical protein VX212_11585, partial [Pseudomonadota bacterium]|nr:hypothetical protein [Pseudomonadota bacterium]